MTMDDIARELGISKKTLYNNFESKKDLIHKTVAFDIEEDAATIADICEQKHDPIAEILVVSQHIGRHLQKINPSVLYDLKKSYPETMELILNMRTHVLLKLLSENLERGIAEGYYRPIVDVEYVPRYFVARLDMLFDDNLFPVSKFPKWKIHANHILYHLHAITNSKGKRILEKHLKNNQWTTAQ